MALAPFKPLAKPQRAWALALVFMRDPGRLQADPAQLRDLYGLTCAAAAVAVDLVRGMSPAEIAAAHGVGGETVHSDMMAAHPGLETCVRTGSALLSIVEAVEAKK